MDPVTCLAVTTVLMLLNGAVLGFVHRDLPEVLRPSAFAWRVSTLLIAGGCVFQAVQAFGPPAFLLPLANGMLTLGVAGYWCALRRFYGERETPWMFVPPLLVVVGVWWFTAVQPNLAVRVVIVSLGWLVPMGGGIRTLLRTSERAVSRAVLVGILAIVGTFLVVRAIYFVAEPDAVKTVTERGSLMNFATPLVAAVLPVIGTNAFLLLCSDRIRRQWERAASTDYLTGLANRRTLGAEGDLRIERARVNGDRLAIAVVDVDHFKSINDRYGHDVGDLALKHVASQLQAACRGKDLPARQGGEEFVVLFDRIEPSQAKSAGERMRVAVEAQPFRSGDVEHRITVSIGVAALTATDNHFDDLLRRADQALYTAKLGGRNRVELAE